MKLVVYVLMLCPIFGVGAQAAIERRMAPAVKKHSYIEEGVITGGESSGMGYSLLDLRRIDAPKDKIERIILDVGDSGGKPLHNKVGYFQVSVEKNQPRVVIDLSQIIASGVNQEKLLQVFKASRFVRSAKINYDPADSSVTIQLTLKKALQIEAFKLPSDEKSSRVVVDLKEKI